MKMKKTWSYLWVSAAVMAVVVVMKTGKVVGDEKELSTKCGEDMEKLMGCLGFATGKESTPSKACCNSVKGIKDSEPECLCFIMQQTHNGSAAVKSLGIQEAKLIQLPSACQLQNASLTICPKLLGLSPSSPDAAIFTNTTSSTSASVTPTTSSPDSSTGNKRRSYFGGGGPLVIAVAIYLKAFPMPYPWG